VGTIFQKNNLSLSKFCEKENAKKKRNHTKKN